MDLAALAAAGAGSLFGYNRENYFFDGEQRIKREYQGQMMRVKQFELFREDIRDLMNLTVAKMDNYLIVNTIQIGLVVVLFTEGRPEPGVAPPWLLFLWSACGAGAFMYVTLCIWLAMHASICSHSFCVRMLTQVVRLPIPTKEQLDAARVLATDFEGTKVREMLRVPVVNQQLKRLHTMVDHLNEAEAGASLPLLDGSDAEETMLDADGRPVATDTLAHVRLYRKMQANWQAYDAYARVSMAMGTNQFLQQLGYTCLIGFITENKSILPGICSVAIFSVCAALLIRLDLYLPFRSLILAWVLNTLPPMVAGISLVLKLAGARTDEPDYLNLVGDAIVPCTFFLHILWLILLLSWAKGKRINDLKLPTTFRAVLYLDVFGWLNSQEVPQELVAAAAGQPEVENAGSALSIVREEEQWQPRASAPEVSAVAPAAEPCEGGAGPCRSSLRDSLAKLCSEMKASLDRDLGSFEAEDVISLMESYEKQTVMDLRKQLKEITGSLSLEDQRATSSSPAPESVAGVWVRLEWNPSGRASQFFRRVRSEDTAVVWTRPMPPDIVLELDEIRVRLESFKMKVQTLISQFSEDPVSQSFEASSCRSGLGIHHRNSSNGSADAASEQLWHLSENARADATEQQFDSRGESVQMAESTATAQDTDAQRVQGGFHPHQGGEDARHSAFAEPGQLPWNTVKQGSLILIGVWCVAFVWTILRLLLDCVDILTPPHRSDPDLQLLYDGPWPQFFEPQGLACDLHRSRLLIAEKHQVYQLQQEESWSLSNSPQEAHCLARAPEFHAAGLTGISLDCSDQKACASILVAEGGEVLQCEKNSSNRLHVFGGPWQMASRQSRHEGFWAHREVEKSPVLLSPGGTSADGQSASFVPSMQLLQHPVAAQQEFIDTLQGGGLLALSKGRLHAWMPRPGTTEAASSAWFPSEWTLDLPKAMGLRWSGMCAAGDSAFLLGKGTGGVELWRLQLSSLLG